VEPLTNPALASMITGQLPHEHGASRNGLRVTAGVDSLPKVLARNGWQTAAVISNWTLKDNISRLGEHFDDYLGVFTRRRYFGLINSEANGSDVTETAITWLDEQRRNHPGQPFMIWIHYIEPHAPYRYQKDFAGALGVRGTDPSKSDRYDTEIAAADHEVGRVLAWLDTHLQRDEVILFFAADHGESLGEHGFWGHGRNLKEPNLRIPMGIAWPGTIEQGVIDAQATIVDVGPTVLDLLSIDIPETFRGVSWAGALTNRARPVERATCYQAHRGAVHGDHESDRARSKGLLSVGRIDGNMKEIITVNNHTRELFDLEQDPEELNSLVDPDSPPSEELVQCLGEISDGLGSLDRITTQKMDQETIEQLRALGYLE
jgi:arylsulfatase A-like enzyme